MAYSYDFFSKQLVGSDKINLNDVFPDIQAEAKQSINVSYGLADIVLFLQDVTQDFQRAERQYIDLDNAIQSIVKKYFSSKNQDNPFKLNTTGVVQVEEGPREPAVIKEGKMKGKGAPKSSIFKTDEPKDNTALKPTDEALEKLKENITDIEEFDLSGEEGVMEEARDLIKETFGDDKSSAKKWFKDNGFDYDKYK